MSSGENSDVVASYDRGLERDRLVEGDGALEFARTQVLLERYLPPAPAVVADVGGGPGRYAVWLVERGYHVHLIDPVRLHLDRAVAVVSATPGLSERSE